jgi:hypothetical protein
MRSTFQVKQTTGFYLRLKVDTASSAAVGQAGGVLLTGTICATGLGHALSVGLRPWHKPPAVHDPAKVVTDLAIALALGGDCLADIAVLRGEPGAFGRVASDPTVSRTIDALARDAPAALKAANAARAAARARAWALAGTNAPDAATDGARPLIVDLDATLVTSHSDKEHARPTFKREFGFYPLCSFVDHGPNGTGEPLAIMLRPGNAGSNTAADHIEVIKASLARLPGHRPGTRPGRRVKVRGDLTGRQAPRRQRQHELVDPVQASLPLADDRRIEGAVPVPGHIDLHRPDLGQHRLGPGAVAGVVPVAPDRVVLVVAEAPGDLLLQGRLEHSLGQPGQESAGADQIDPFEHGLIHQLLSELMPLDLIELHHGLDRLCHGAAFPPGNARRLGPDQQLHR